MPWTQSGPARPSHRELQRVASTNIAIRVSLRLCCGNWPFNLTRECVELRLKDWGLRSVHSTCYTILHYVPLLWRTHSTLCESLVHIIIKPIVDEWSTTHKAPFTSRDMTAVKSTVHNGSGVLAKRICINITFSLWTVGFGWNLFVRCPITYLTYILYPNHLTWSVKLGIVELGSNNFLAQ